MATMEQRDECEHGSLRRSCRVCEMEAEVATLRAEHTAALARLVTLETALAEAREEMQRLRAALVKLIGADTREELEAMEVFIRTAPVPAEDKAVSIDAIHALLATLPALTGAGPAGSET